MKAEIFRKSFNIAFDLFVDSSSFHSIKYCQIAVKQHLFVANDSNHFTNLRIHKRIERNYFFFFIHFILL